MGLALAIGVVLLSGGPATSTPQDGVAELVRAACVDTGLNREAFEELGRARRWRSVQMSRNTGRGWHVNFRTPGALVMLTGDLLPAVNDPAKGVMCAVSVDRARDDLMADIEALASSLGLDAEPQSEGFGGSDVRMWSKFGEMTLTYASNPTDPRAVISLSHQTVTAGE